MDRADRPGFEFFGTDVLGDAGQVLLKELSWSVQSGESWAIVGPTASGKSTLLQAIRGKYRTVNGSLRTPSGIVRMVGFKEESRTFSYAGHYYQQRFEFADSDEPLSVRQYLAAGNSVDDSRIQNVSDSLGIHGHLDQPFLTLSNGQTRRARIARALLAQPDWLLLDDPFIGIDQAGRTDIAERLGAIAASGCGLILATAPEWVPEWVSNVLELSAGKIVFSGSRQKWSEHLGSSLAVASSPAAATEIASKSSPVSATEAVIELVNVVIKHGGKNLLDGINWTVRQGERWAVFGPNGAGKTTLLSLVCGDHPQAFSNEVRLFGKRRGGGETIWDVKRNIGFVSPEFHLYFREKLTGFEAAATAFRDSLLYKPPTPEQAQRVRELFTAFGCEELQNRKFHQMSIGQQRLVLLVRAVVKDPPLLILDEPFQGLDQQLVDRIRNWLDETIRPEQTLVFVTHVASHLPRIVTRRLHLVEGRVVNPTESG